MKIIFIDQLGCYAAVLAACCRAGIIGADPTIREICSLPNFAAHKDLSVGRLYYIGTDRTGAQLYTLGAGGEGRLMSVSIKDLLKIQEIKEAVCLVDVSKYNALLTRLCWRVSIIPVFKPAAVYLAACQLKKGMSALSKYVTTQMDKMIKFD